MKSGHEQHLLWVLLILVLAVAPTCLFGQLNQPRAEALAEAEQQAALERQKAQAVREAEIDLERLASVAAVPADRLVGEKPFADMEQALRQVAGAAGIGIERLTMLSAEAVEAVPGLVQYEAEVRLRGSYDQFLAFLRGLEGHRLLVEIPDVVLDLPSDGRDELTPSLTLHFYRQTATEPDAE